MSHEVGSMGVSCIDEKDNRLTIVHKIHPRIIKELSTLTPPKTMGDLTLLVVLLNGKQILLHTLHTKRLLKCLFLTYCQLIVVCLATLIFLFFPFVY